jgi:hypothetical protein
MTQRISIGEVTGGWKDAASNVNALISDLRALPCRKRHA